MVTQHGRHEWGRVYHNALRHILLSHVSVYPVVFTVIHASVQSSEDQGLCWQSTHLWQQGHCSLQQVGFIKEKQWWSTQYLFYMELKMLLFTGDAEYSVIRIIIIYSIDIYLSIVIIKWNWWQALGQCSFTMPLFRLSKTRSICL